MKKRVTILFLAVIFSLTTYGQNVPYTRTEAGRTTEKTMHSNVFNEDRAYSIYLPQSYDKEPNKKYPIFYLLHGASDDNRCYENKAGLSSIVNTLMATGQISEMIIVTPNAGGEKYEGYYKIDDYDFEPFFFNEFIPYIEKTYRVIADKNHRAIGGLSMGGGGSTWYTLTHPDMFCAVYEMSGALSISEKSSLYRQTREPGDKASLKIQSYKEHNCIKYVEDSTDEQKAKYKEILWYVDCGDDDFTLDWNVDFHRVMLEQGIPCEMRVRNGGHTWTYWSEGLQIALPVLSIKFNQK